MVRFDIAVANRNRSEVFWQGWPTFRNFSIKHDRLVILDASDDPARELAICKHYIRHYGLDGINFVFLRRRAWNYSLGMIADYTRLIGEGILTAPEHTFFMQDHYVCTTECVASDTIPEGGVLDLNEIQSLFEKEPKLVVSSTRVGFRICASVPYEIAGKDGESYDGRTDIPWIIPRGKLGSIVGGKYMVDHFIYYDGGNDLPGSTDQCLAFDGANFCVDPRYIVSHYLKNKELYSEGIGDYGDAVMWETRIGKVLYDQGLSYYELSRGRMIRSIEELKSLQPKPNWRHLITNLWSYLYNAPLFFSAHKGEDVREYPFRQTDAYRRYQAFCAQWRKTMNHDTTIYLLYDSKKDASNFGGAYPAPVKSLFERTPLPTDQDGAVPGYADSRVKGIVRARARRRLLERRVATPISEGMQYCREFPGRVVRKLKRMARQRALAR